MQPIIAAIRAVGFAIFVIGVSRVGVAEDQIDFGRDIRPILSENCFFCHGPDAATREAGLRLDVEEAAHEYAIVPGDAEASEVVARISSDDPGLQMPPPDSNRSLTPEEISLLRRWIEEGAAYRQHWSFTPVVRPSIPTSEGQYAVANAIDAFVRDRLRAQGLQQQPSADRQTLIRRLSLDLIGLPPTPAEIDTFLSDDSPDAYERLVDRLLASEAFGERWASIWLDAARYADTYGYQNDRYREMWPWRDWVIEALNRNLPYDDFLTWQLAGDLLDDPSREQILATAFNRNHRQTNEGGSIEEEFRQEYVADRVNTLGTAVLGLTLECARCHDHKYDPITQANYYQLAAYFDNIDESGLYSHFTEAVPTPTLWLTTPEQEREIAEIERKIATAERELAELETKRGTAYQTWREQLGQAVEAKQSVDDPATERGGIKDALDNALAQGLLGEFRFESLDGGKVVNEVDTETPGRLVDQPRSVEGRHGKGVALSGDNAVVVKPGGSFTRNDPFTISLWLKVPQAYQRAVVLHRSRAWTDSGSRGYELLIENGKLSAGLIHFWPGNAIRIVSEQTVPVDEWFHVAIAYDGSSRAAGLRLFVDGDRAATTVVRDKLRKHIKGADGFSGGEVNELAIGQRFRDKGLKGGKVDELRIYNRALSGLEIEQLSGAAAIENHKVRSFYLQSIDSQLAAKRQALKALRQRRSEITNTVREIMVMREMESPRPTHVLERGAYDAPGEEVQPGTPESLPGGPGELPSNRLGLARWLTSDQHPLTARVAVNRIWQALFGRGLVETAEDFGSQGALPTYPELLDWLAWRYRDTGWDTKRLIRTIVTSRTYRQSSDASESLRAQDPENALLARGPSHRLSAETLRDLALRASGMIVTRTGGPPVKPYQPPGLWKEKSGQAYRRDPGPGSHRRSLYTFWKRTSPPPSMMVFDASNREVCVVRRQVTATPLQILVLLNDPQFVEAATALAARAMREAGPDPAAQIAYAFRWLTGRHPDRAESDILQQLYDAERKNFAAEKSSARQLIEAGDFDPDEELPPADLAALTIVVESLFGYDETVMKR